MHMTRRTNEARTVIGWRLLAALLAIVSLVAAACGDDAPSDSAVEPAPTAAADADDAAALEEAQADAAAARAEADAAAAAAAEAEAALAEAMAAAESDEGVDPSIVADLEIQLQEAQEAAAEAEALAAAEAEAAAQAEEAAAAAAAAVPVDDRNCVDEVVIGTVWPMSGTFSFVGSAEIAGATKAVEDINAAGGIESLCGATLRLAIYDAGGSAEEAATAVERLLDDEPEVSAIAGSWLSSFSLAATEVSERAGIPFVTESFADSVTDREGFSHVFGYSPPASAIKGLILDAIQPGLDQAGITMETVAVVGSTSAAAVPLQQALLAEFGERGIEVAVTDTWAPGGLDDPSGVATKIANADVDVIFNIAFAFSDVSGLQNELIARGVTAPVVQNGGQGLLPAWADLGPEVAGLSTFVYANPLAGTDAFDELAAAIDQPYARQDHIGGYFVVHLIAAALEQSGDPSPAAVTKAFNTVKLTEGVAVDLMPTSAISFSSTGRVDQHFGVLAQWQEVDGRLIPCTVYPLEFAVCQPVWS
ncbi:MAG: ABC transporter substrate-binding protein [Acidimicrobiaceae bacterium]|nr:ABC transporter substrate-binding protein [Acidimicrobiaceae bacterium]MYH76264.1 ABC transporter substrate-binding protein [Acidimicrobiaceae bacterium]MYK77244.1 ABC transporter substrate-binding protein [Acidimicrobiaceae bacterium]